MSDNRPLSFTHRYKVMCNGEILGYYSNLQAAVRTAHDMGISTPDVAVLGPENLVFDLESVDYYFANHCFHGDD